MKRRNRAQIEAALSLYIDNYFAWVQQESARRGPIDWIETKQEFIKMILDVLEGKL